MLHSAAFIFLTHMRKGKVASPAAAMNMNVVPGLRLCVSVIEKMYGQRVLAAKAATDSAEAMMLNIDPEGTYTARRKGSRQVME